MCYVVRISLAPSLLHLPFTFSVFSCVFLTTKPIYAQLDLLLRGTIHVFMTGCLLRLSTLRIAVAFLINIKCAQATQRQQSQEKVSLCSTQSTQERREGRGGQQVSCLYVLWAGHTTVLQSPFTARLLFI